MTQPAQPADPITGATDPTSTSDTANTDAATQAPSPTPSPAPGTTPDTTSAPASSTASGDTDVQSQLDELRALVGQLSTELAARPPAPSPVAPITSTAPTSGPVPAAVAGAGAPSHAMHSVTSAGDLEEGALIRYNVPAANGGDPLTGYGMVIGRVDVNDVAVSVDSDGNVTRKVLDSTHPEFIVAQLDVLGVRLQAANIVDEDTSTQVQTRLDQAAAG